MKHLKSFKFVKIFNEEVNFEWEDNPECVRLQNEINEFNKKLIDDEVWRNFYHHIPLYYEKQKDPKFLESIIEFAKKRIEDIQKENVLLQQDIKDIFQEFEDDVDFIKEIKYKQINEMKFDLWIELFLTEDVEDIDYFGLLPYYTSFANENIWKNLSIIAERVKSYGLECFINYNVSKKINFRIK